MHVCMDVQASGDIVIGIMMMMAYVNMRAEEVVEGVWKTMRHALPAGRC